MPVSRLDEYDQQRLIQLDKLDKSVIIYDIPITELQSGALVSKKFQLNEYDAGIVLHEIINNRKLIENLLSQAKIADKSDPHEFVCNVRTDPNQVEITRIVRSKLPNAPTSIAFWFSRLSYDYARSIGG